LTMPGVKCVHMAGEKSVQGEVLPAAFVDAAFCVSVTFRKASSRLHRQKIAGRVRAEAMTALSSD